MHAAHDREFVRDPRTTRQMLAELQPWHTGRDRLEVTANLGGSIGLQVPGIQVARPAIQEEHDAGLDMGRGRDA